jgi:hypothetical protein
MSMEETFEVMIPRDIAHRPTQPIQAMQPVRSSQSTSYRDNPIDLQLAAGESPWAISSRSRGQSGDNALITLCNTVNDILQQEGILEVSTRWEAGMNGERRIVFDVEFVSSTEQAELLLRRLWSRLLREGLIGEQKMERFSSRLANRLGIDLGLAEVREKNRLLVGRKGLHPRSILYQDTLRSRRRNPPTSAWMLSGTAAR